MSREPKGELDQKWRSLPWTREVAPKVENLSKRVLEMWSETPAVWCEVGCEKKWTWVVGNLVE